MVPSKLEIPRSCQPTVTDVNENRDKSIRIAPHLVLS